MEDMKNIAMIFRGKDRHEMSIETLFGCIIPILKQKNEICSYFMPYGHHNKIGNIIKNLSFAHKIKADVYHITGEVYIAACVTPKDKTIITMHDYVNLEMFSGPKKFLSWLLWDYIPLKRCRYVACISQKVCEETLARFPFTKDKIVYIPNAISADYTYTPNEFNCDKPIILAMGTRSNKNLENIVRAIKGIRCKLHIIGRLSDEQKNLLVKNEVEFENAYNVADEEILNAYKNCDMVCFPSLYEGFGRPIIEGQAIGRPVITSNMEPMRSVAGEGALLVDPNDCGQIRNAVIEIIENDKTRKRLVAAGLENVKQYSAESVAGKYTELYESIE